jgi:hypothetical protein
MKGYSKRRLTLSGNEITGNVTEEMIARYIENHTVEQALKKLVSVPPTPRCRLESRTVPSANVPFHDLYVQARANHSQQVPDAVPISFPNTGLRYLVIHTMWYFKSYTQCDAFRYCYTVPQAY